HRPRGQPNRRICPRLRVQPVAHREADGGGVIRAPLPHTGRSGRSGEARDTPHEVGFFSSLLYRVAVERQSGLVLSYDEHAKPSFMDCLYFSVVTISSLGYGDLRPVGVGRLIATLEVSTGLVI